MGPNKTKEIRNEEIVTKENLPQEETKETERQQSKPKKKRGKKYKETLNLLQKEEYTLDEALELLKKASYTKFDPTVELHFNLSTDPKKSDQIIRQTANFPHGIKKNIKILVFGNEKQLEEAKQAGAQYFGDKETIEKIKNGWLDFDKVIATPEMMPKIAILAKILGPKGLMPNPKNNTLTNNISETIKNLLSGTTVEIKTEKEFPIIHTKIGKLSFEKKKLQENFYAIYKTIVIAKPPKVKNPYIKTLIITTTMGPGIKIDLTSIS